MRRHSQPTDLIVPIQTSRGSTVLLCSCTPVHTGFSQCEGVESCVRTGDPPSREAAGVTLIWEGAEVYTLPPARASSVFGKCNQSPDKFYRTLQSQRQRTSDRRL